MRNENLVRLTEQLSSVKKAEENARKRRVELELQIVSVTGFCKSEGAETFDAEGKDGQCQVTLNQPVRYKVSSDWPSLRRTLPKDHPGRAVVKTTFALDIAAAKDLRTNDPKAWAEISEAVNSKPGKIAVAIKEIRLA